MMFVVTASRVGSVTNLSFSPQFLNTNDASSSLTPLTSPSHIKLLPSSSSPLLLRKSPSIHRPSCNTNASVFVDLSDIEGNVEEEATTEPQEIVLEKPTRAKSSREARRSADWKTAQAYKESGAIHEGIVEGSNKGGLRVRFFSLHGFLPYSRMSPSYSCKEPDKSLPEIGRELVGSVISVKVVQATDTVGGLIFCERTAIWSKFSGQINEGDILSARVATLEDYGAFVHLRFPDGYYHITGLVHVSEVSWDLVQDVRDFLSEGDEVQVKVVKLDREKCRIALSIKQLEDDPLLETLDKVIPEIDQCSTNTSDTPECSNIEPLPGLDSICKGLLQENGITEVRISRQGFEKRVVSQDLQLWLSNGPVLENQFTLLARAGRQVQEIQLTTTLDRKGIKMALQKVLERVP